MRRFLLIFGLLALALFGASYWYATRQPSGDEGDLELDHADEIGTRAITLYFGNAQGDALVSETRTIQARRYRDEEVEAVLDELLRGPTAAGAVSPFPVGTQLRGAFYDEDAHLLYLDFNQSLVAEEMGGSAMELMTLGAILRTIAVDFPEMSSVQILVDGLEVETLGGNLDLTRPLRPGEWL